MRFVYYKHITELDFIDFRPKENPWGNLFEMRKRIDPSVLYDKTLGASPLTNLFVFPFGRQPRFAYLQSVEALSQLLSLQSYLSLFHGIF